MPPIEFDNLCKGAFDEIKRTLAVSFTYQPKSGIGVFENIRGVFDDRAQEVDPDTEIAISSNVYTLGVKLDDLPLAPSKGDKVIINSVSYKIIDSLEDGVPGVSTVLMLHRVD